MSETNDQNTCSRDPLRPLVLCRADDHWLASPAKGDRSRGRGFAPFYLPLPPRQLVDWLVVAGQRFWNQRQRCMAALLLIDVRFHRWTLRLPRQRCGSDAASWTNSAEDLVPLAPTLRLAGSFQTLAGPQFPEDLVPSVAGFHFMLSLTARCPLRAFVLQGGDLKSVEPSAVLANDWAEVLEEAMPRLHLA
jgi:hypothetical protein